jgi:hypothetical protein
MAMVKGEKSYEEEVIIVNGYNVTCGFNDIRSYRLWKHLISLTGMTRLNLIS